MTAKKVVTKAPFDAESIKNSEYRFVERKAGTSIESMAKDASRQIEFLVAIAAIAKSREGEMTLEEAWDWADDQTPIAVNKFLGYDTLPKPEAIDSDEQARAVISAFGG